MTLYKVGDNVKCTNTNPLLGNSVAPPLEQDKVYPVLGITLDSKGNQHLDVGLLSVYQFIKSFETQEVLPDSDKIHWCHPSRFEYMSMDEFMIQHSE